MSAAVAAWRGLRAPLGLDGFLLRGLDDRGLAIGLAGPPLECAAGIITPIMRRAWAAMVPEASKCPVLRRCPMARAMAFMPFAQR